MNRVHLARRDYKLTWNNIIGFNLLFNENQGRELWTKTNPYHFYKIHTLFFHIKKCFTLSTAMLFGLNTSCESDCKLTWCNEIGFNLLFNGNQGWEFWTKSNPIHAI